MRSQVSRPENVRNFLFVTVAPGFGGAYLARRALHVRYASRRERPGLQGLLMHVLVDSIESYERMDCYYLGLFYWCFCTQLAVCLLALLASQFSFILPLIFYSKCYRLLSPLGQSRRPLGQRRRLVARRRPSTQAPACYRPLSPTLLPPLRYIDAETWGQRGQSARYIAVTLPLHCRFGSPPALPLASPGRAWWRLAACFGLRALPRVGGDGSATGRASEVAGSAGCRPAGGATASG